MAAKEADLMELPFEMVNNSAGFSLDIGGSMAKLIYVDKEDWDEKANAPKKSDAGLVNVRLMEFSREKIQDMIGYVREHSHIRHVTGKDTVVPTTGVGCNRHRKEIEAALNIRLKNLPETDVSVKGFRFLQKHLPDDKFLHKVPPQSLQMFQKRLMDFQEMMKKVESHGMKVKMAAESKREGATEATDSTASKHDSCAAAAKTDIYPCLLCTMGSAIGFMKLDSAEAVGTYLDISNRGGRLFQGLGAILTGAESYEELIELAKQGDSSNVNTLSGDDVQAGSDGDVYSSLPPDILTFCFGKGVNRKIDDFKKEDLARAVLHMLCIDMATAIHITQREQNANTAFLCGGFVNQELVRELLTTEFMYHTIVRGDVGQRDIRFVKNGNHLGAIGAFLEGQI